MLCFLNDVRFSLFYFSGLYHFGVRVRLYLAFGGDVVHDLQLHQTAADLKL